MEAVSYLGNNIMNKAIENLALEGWIMGQQEAGKSRIEISFQIFGYNFQILDTVLFEHLP